MLAVNGVAQKNWVKWPMGTSFLFPIGGGSIVGYFSISHGGESNEEQSMEKIAQTIGQLFLQRIDQSAAGDRAIGWFEGGVVKFMTAGEYGQLVQSLAMGFRELGVGRDSKVAILSNTRKEWHFCDVAILASRGVTVPIYQSYTASEVKYIFNHSDARVLVVENDEQLVKVLEAQEQLAALEYIVLLDTVSESNRQKIKPGVRVHTFDELLALGKAAGEREPEFFVTNIHQQTGDEVGSIIYTSGTTGEPKGVVITQEALITMLNNVKQLIGPAFGPSDRTLTWLPLAHVFGRCESLLLLVFGWEMVFAEGIDRLIDNLAVVRPTALLAVPRIFEKIYAKVNDQVNAGSLVKKAIFKWAQITSQNYHDKLGRDLSPSPREILQTKLAYRLVFKKIYDRFGGRLRYLISGGAPISVEIVKFLRNANLHILEGYGLTETVAPCTINPVEKQIPGTVGIPIGDVEIKIADDGEILIKSKALLREYFKKPRGDSGGDERGVVLYRRHRGVDSRGLP